MNLLKHCSRLLVAASLLSALGCAADSGKPSAGEILDDSVITSKVKTAIFNEPSLKTFQIGVETYKNVVQLSGFVATRGEMHKAAEVAGKVNGVRSVSNGIQVK